MHTDPQSNATPYLSLQHRSFRSHRPRLVDPSAEPWRLGLYEALVGAPVNANPYPFGNPEWEQWKWGWQMAHSACDDKPALAHALSSHRRAL
ncbi:MAG TPA: hypothetical protein VNN09_15065 [Candidatus Competibacteraceae bacterium]|nr:hypothetical protein [Candidatus Competibacteraceae bacterium]